MTQRPLSAPLPLQRESGISPKCPSLLPRVGSWYPSMGQTVEAFAYRAVYLPRSTRLNNFGFLVSVMLTITLKLLEFVLYPDF